MHHPLPLCLLFAVLCCTSPVSLRHHTTSASDELTNADMIACMEMKWKNKSINLV